MATAVASSATPKILRSSGTELVEPRAERRREEEREEDLRTWNDDSQLFEKLPEPLSFLGYLVGHVSVSRARLRCTGQAAVAPSGRIVERFLALAIYGRIIGSASMMSVQWIGSDVAPVMDVVSNEPANPTWVLDLVAMVSELRSNIDSEAVTGLSSNQALEVLQKATSTV